MAELKNRRRVRMPAGVMLDDIPGLTDALRKAEANQFQTREDSLLGLHQDLCGFTVRTMTVLDYVLLDRNQSPFLYRREPTMGALSLFLWVLSPGYAAWRDGIGWRKHLPTLQPVAAYLYSRRVRKAFGKKIPETSEAVVVKCFEYIDRMFFDAPAGLARRGGESCMCYLTGWFDSMQSEYHCTDEKIWHMGLPELFQRMKAIQQRHNPSMPKFNKNTDAVKAWVLRGLHSKDFTLDELKSGKVPIPQNFNLN